MSQTERDRTPLYFIAEELGELRREMQRLKEDRKFDREQITILLKHNRTLRSQLSRLSKRVFDSGQTSSKSNQSPTTRPKPELSSSSGDLRPDFGAPAEEMTANNRMHS